MTTPRPETRRIIPFNRPKPTRYHRKPKLVADIKPSTDPVFTRLMLDIQLARRAQTEKIRGVIPESRREKGIALEKGAFEHLFNYLNAKAWTRDEGKVD